MVAWACCEAVAPVELVAGAEGERRTGLSGLVRVRRALVSVSDKRGVVGFANTLVGHGVEIVSTGGTACALREAGVAVIDVSEVTGFEEVMGGRVKTLHPMVHGGILARRDDAGDAAVMERLGITGIDLVCVNLYPFERTVARDGVTHGEAVEQIDIGGATMVRAAAKNHAHVLVVTDPVQYAEVTDELAAHKGCTGVAVRERFAARAFARTAAYDVAIAGYLSGEGDGEGVGIGVRVAAGLVGGVEALKYGENPHQRAWAVRSGDGDGNGTLAGARQVHGKALGYNNINDASAAWRLAKELGTLGGWRFGAAVVKHTNPCGAAVAGRAVDAVDLAMLGDPLAAYGGILAVSGVLDRASAERVCEEGVFLEAVIAPSIEESALGVLRERWKNLRVLIVGEGAQDGGGLDVRAVDGGMLIQERDGANEAAAGWALWAGECAGDHELRAAEVVWTVCKHLTSNAVAIGGEDADGRGVRLFGAGAGQMDRVASCRIAVEKSGDCAMGAIAASDAFFPFSDGACVLIDAGVRMIVHPGGSKRDGETFAVCEEAGVRCYTTGVRHFRH